MRPANAQADLNLRWAHISVGTRSITAHLTQNVRTSTLQHARQAKTLNRLLYRAISLFDGLSVGSQLFVTATGLRQTSIIPRLMRHALF